MTVQGSPGGFRYPAIASITRSDPGAIAAAYMYILRAEAELTR
jgi:hypothetical protein